MPSPLGSFLARHWRGELSLSAAFWRVCVPGIVAYGLAVAAVAVAARQDDLAFDPWLTMGVLGFIWLGAAALIVFLTVGTWRSAGRSLEAGRAAKRTGVWALLARIAVVLAIVALGTQFLRVGLPQLLEANRMAFLGDPGIADYSLRLTRDGTEVEISGGFKHGLSRDAEKLFASAPDLKVVHLNSGGGRFGEAVRLARLIRERGLITYSSASCSSACVVAFLAGRERWLKAGARLGFHRENFGGIESTQATRQLLTEAGLPTSFVDRAVAADSASMWYPSVPELLAAGAITGVTDDYRFAASGYGSHADAGSFAETLRRTPLFAAIEGTEPAVFADIVDAFYRAYLEGQPEGRILDDMRARKVTPTIMARLTRADDRLLADYARLMADQYEALGQRDVTACYRYAALGADTTMVNMLPATLRQREMELSERVLGSTAKRAPPRAERTQPIYRAIFEKLSAQYGQAQVRLLADPARVPPIEYGNYCKLAIALFRAIADLPPEQAGEVMSHIFSTTGGRK